MFNTVVNFTNDILWNKNVMVGILLFSGIFFTIKTRGVQFRLLKHMTELLFTKSDTGKNQVSSFQAFCVSTASRVGVGNLAGVVAAVAAGGPGAVFWMWVFVSLILS